jgi:hypothetical protein
MGHWHDILGLQDNATPAEIRAAYRKKALEFHPDRCKAPDAAEKFMEVNDAYRALLEPKPESIKPVRKSKSKPARPPDIIHIYDAPPPTRDIWGKPIRKEDGWRDTFANQYEKDKPVRFPVARIPEKAPDIDLWSQSSSKKDRFLAEYWREYARLKRTMVYEEPEKFWEVLDEWVKNNR